MNEAALNRLLSELLDALRCAEAKADVPLTDRTSLVVRFDADPEALLLEVASQLRETVASL